MREGEVYCCDECGLRIEVIEECSHDDGDDDDETCSIEGFMCCGRPLTLKED
jgi:hypothetical protein